MTKTVCRNRLRVLLGRLVPEWTDSDDDVFANGLRVESDIENGDETRNGEDWATSCPTLVEPAKVRDRVMGSDIRVL